MVPRRGEKAALLEPAQQRIDLVGVDRNQVAADLVDPLHQAVAVVGLLLDQVHHECRKARLALDRPLEDLVDPMVMGNGVHSPGFGLVLKTPSASDGKLGNPQLLADHGGKM